MKSKQPNKYILRRGFTTETTCIKLPWWLWLSPLLASYLQEVTTKKYFIDLIDKNGNVERIYEKTK